MDKEYYNASGYPDPTAYKALKNIQRDEINGNVNLLIKTLKETIAENGFLLLNRIELKEIKSGKVFK